MVATRGRTFKRPWRRSCLSSKLKSSSAPIRRKDSWCFHGVGSSNEPLLGSTAAEGLPRIGRTSIATRWRSCALPQSASCSENFVIPPDVFGQTLRLCMTHAVSELRNHQKSRLHRTFLPSSEVAHVLTTEKHRSISFQQCLVMLLMSCIAEIPVGPCSCTEGYVGPGDRHTLPQRCSVIF